jgi:hypothetical protein
MVAVIFGALHIAVPPSFPPNLFGGTMKRLALTLAALGLCATASACDGSRGLTEPAGRVQNIGTMGSGYRDGTEGDSSATTQNIGTSGSGHREDDPITTQDNGGTMGSGHKESTAGSVIVTTQNLGMMGSGL